MISLTAMYCTPHHTASDLNGLCRVSFSLCQSAGDRRCSRRPAVL
uniref:Uncharacterized protein n=1 Tax=Setaria italica TaxID=4555 RepID=K4ANN8_SETIT